jgi:putative NADPH-quinone reductase
MRVMVTVDHPWERSFCHAILKRVVTVLEEQGHAVDVLDLHKEGFDPVLRASELAGYSQGSYLDPKVGRYQERIARSDHLVYIFPVWWEVMPAMLKGFFDKVFLPGWAFVEADASPLLTRIGGATAITTMGAPEPIYTSVEPVLCKGILGFCGIQTCQWFNICEVQLKTTDERETWLVEIEIYLRSLA